MALVRAMDLSRRSSVGRQSGACWPIGNSGAAVVVAAVVLLEVVAGWEAVGAEIFGGANSVVSAPAC